MHKKLLLLTTILMSGCSLAPDFKMPDLKLPEAYKEQTAPDAEKKGNWKPAMCMEKIDRGQWWLIFGDAQLNDLETQATQANLTLQAAAQRVEQARALVRVNEASFLPNVDIGANAVRTKFPAATTAEFGQAPQQLKPINLYSAQGSVSYEADLFGRVRDTASASRLDADTAEATYRSLLLSLQADVAQNYFAIRVLDSQRQLLRDTANMRTEANRIMQKRFDVGEAAQQDLLRTQTDLASVQADLLSLDRARAQTEHALAVQLGKLPSEYSFAEAPLLSLPPNIPAGLPSALLERRPDISAAISNMASANKRIGIARTAFFPSLMLTASGGFESTEFGDLFKWGSRTWALGQLAGSELTMPLFDFGRNQARLDIAKAAYEESVANYRQQVLVAFKEVEDNLVAQRLLTDQSLQSDAAAAAANSTTNLVQKRYDEGDTDYFEVVTVQRDSLAASRAAIDVKGQRFAAAISLIRALGGGWDTPAKE